jgi:hypothetical protein
VVRFLNLFGVTSPELQTIGWFGVTIVGVALVNGGVTRWEPVDRLVAALCVAGICWLVVHAKA